MSTQKLMRGLSDSNIHTASNNELLNKAASATTTWPDDLFPPTPRSEAHAFVAGRRFSHTDRAASEL
jgi:hypothetical protein